MKPLTYKNHEYGRLRTGCIDSVGLLWRETGEKFFLIAKSYGPQKEQMARRIAACWNACEGVSTEALESGEMTLIPSTFGDEIY